MRVAQNRSAWRELWRPSASSGMKGWDDDDDDSTITDPTFRTDSTFFFEFLPS